MKSIGIQATVLGTAMNFLLFVAKLYVGISTNSLSVYCDAMNNLGDTLACIIGMIGFVLVKKMSEKKSARTQSLCTFVISLIIALTGAYFIYNGLERMLYPLPVSYSVNYAIIIIVTIVVKIIMGAMYYGMSKKEPSPVLKALVLDSILDCCLTAFVLMGLFIVGKLNYAVDGIFAIITGACITISAIKNIITQSKRLIND